MSTINKHFIKNNGATVVLAKTIKGKGFSYFESSKFTKDLNFYPYHSGPVPQKLYLGAIDEILLKIKIFSRIKKINMPVTKKRKIIQKIQTHKNTKKCRALNLFFLPISRARKNITRPEIIKNISNKLILFAYNYILGTGTINRQRFHV